MAIDPVLLRFRSALADLYGERLSHVVLYGSRARGDATTTSDYDVAVFLDKVDDFGLEARRLSAIETNLLLADGAVINSLPLAAEVQGQRSPFMSEVRRDGREF